MRKQFLFILGISFVFVCLFSCQGKKEKSADSLDALSRPKMIINSEDSAAVYQLLNGYLDLLKDGNLDGAVSSLRCLNDKDSLMLLTDVQMKSLRGSLMMMSGKDFRIEYLKFNRDFDNEARIKCILFENKPGENAPNEISMTLRPVRYAGTWYLTPADDATRSSELAK